MPGQKCCEMIKRPSVYTSKHGTYNSLSLTLLHPRIETRLSPKVVPPPDFTTRTGAALNKIAEEHWRRQMEQEQQEEEQV